MIRLASSFSGRTSDSERESALEATAQPQDEDVVELGEAVPRVPSSDGRGGAGVPVRRCPGGGRLADTRTPRSWLGTPGEAENNFLELSAAEHQRLKIHPLRPSTISVRFSYQLIVPLEDDARAKPDIMAPQTASAIWPVI
jgi:hypothetical protein